MPCDRAMFSLSSDGPNRWALSAESVSLKKKVRNEQKAASTNKQNCLH